MQRFLKITVYDFQNRSEMWRFTLDYFLENKIHVYAKRWVCKLTDTLKLKNVKLIINGNLKFLLLW